MTPYAEAVAAALARAMRADDRIIALGPRPAGEEPGSAGAAPPATTAPDTSGRSPSGPLAAFGARRVVTTPAGAAAACGVAVGAARAGLRPVLELPDGHDLGAALDLLTAAGAAALRSGGQVSVPMVVRARWARPAAGLGGPGADVAAVRAAGWLARVPGVRVLLPASPHDGAALLPSALAEPGPVVIVESPALADAAEPLPDEVPPEPLGTARVRRPGVDVTVVALGRLVPEALAAAERLADQGVDVEVIDPRSLVPLPTATLVDSAARTGRVVVAADDPGPGGIGADIAVRIQALAFYDLDGPVVQVAAPSGPLPVVATGGETGLPMCAELEAAVRRALR